MILVSLERYFLSAVDREQSGAGQAKRSVPILLFTERALLDWQVIWESPLHHVQTRLKGVHERLVGVAGGDESFRFAKAHYVSHALLALVVNRPVHVSRVIWPAVGHDGSIANVERRQHRSRRGLCGWVHFDLILWLRLRVAVKAARPVILWRLRYASNCASVISRVGFGFTL